MDVRSLWSINLIASADNKDRGYLTNSKKNISKESLKIAIVLFLRGEISQIFHQTFARFVSSIFFFTLGTNRATMVELLSIPLGKKNEGKGWFPVDKSFANATQLTGIAQLKFDDRSARSLPYFGRGRNPGLVGLAQFQAGRFVMQVLRRQRAFSDLCFLALAQHAYINGVLCEDAVRSTWW